MVSRPLLSVFDDDSPDTQTYGLDFEHIDGILSSNDEVPIIKMLNGTVTTLSLCTFKLKSYKQGEGQPRLLEPYLLR